MGSEKVETVSTDNSLKKFQYEVEERVGWPLGNTLSLRRAF